MTDSRRSFADDFDEFDHLLDDDVEPAAATMVARPVRGGAGSGAATAVARPKAPRRKAPRAAKQGGGSRPSIRITPDWNRVIAVVLVAVAVLAVLYFTVSSIASSRRASSFKDYFGEVRDIATQSAAQGAELEAIFQDPNGGDRSQRIASIEQLGARADKLVKDAKAIDAPDQLATAHAWFVTSLEYRASGLDAVQQALSASIDSKDQDASANAVAQALARLVASDVVYADSFAVEGRNVLKADEVHGVQVPDSVFVKDLEALSPAGIEKTLDRLKVSGAVTAGGAQAAPPKDGKIRGGQLESGRVTVAPSGQTLVPGSLTEIKGSDNVQFEVPFTNQGEVQLTEVPVKITLRGSESDPMTLTGVIDVVDPGQTATAKVPLDEIPNFGEVLDMTILVGPIPGEKTADNNTADYQVQFSL